MRSIRSKSRGVTLAEVLAATCVVLALLAILTPCFGRGGTQSVYAANLKLLATALLQ